MKSLQQWLTEIEESQVCPPFLAVLSKSLNQTRAPALRSEEVDYAILGKTGVHIYLVPWALLPESAQRTNLCPVVIVSTSSVRRDDSGQTQKESTQPRRNPRMRHKPKADEPTDNQE